MASQHSDPTLLPVSPADPVWHVEQVIDGATYAARITVPRAELLEQVFAAAHDDPGIRAEAMIAMRSAGGPRRTMACRVIADLLDARFTDRMVVDLDPGDADTFADRLADAAREPAWCSRCSSEYAQFGDLGPACSAEDDDRHARVS